MERLFAMLPFGTAYCCYSRLQMFLPGVLLASPNFGMYDRNVLTSSRFTIHLPLPPQCAIKHVQTHTPSLTHAHNLTHTRTNTHTYHLLSQCLLLTRSYKRTVWFHMCYSRYCCCFGFTICSITLGPSVAGVGVAEGGEEERRRRAVFCRKFFFFSFFAINDHFTFRTDGGKVVHG